MHERLADSPRSVRGVFEPCGWHPARRPQPHGRNQRRALDPLGQRPIGHQHRRVCAQSQGKTRMRGSPRSCTTLTSTVCGRPSRRCIRRPLVATHPRGPGGGVYRWHPRGRVRRRGVNSAQTDPRRRAAARAARGRRSPGGCLAAVARGWIADVRRPLLHAAGAGVSLFATRECRVTELRATASTMAATWRRPPQSSPGRTPSRRRPGWRRWA